MKRALLIGFGSLLACAEDNPGLYIQVEPASASVQAFLVIVREVESQVPCATPTPVFPGGVAEVRCATTSRIDQTYKAFMPIKVMSYEALEVYVLGYEQSAANSVPTASGCAALDLGADSEPARIATVSISPISAQSPALEATLGSCGIEAR